MLDRRTFGERLFDGINIAFMWFMILIMVYPLYYVIVASLSDPDLLLAQTGLLWSPVGFSFDAYKAVLNYPSIMLSARNTIIIVVLSLALNMIMTCFGAYFLSRRGIMLRRFMMKLLTMTMYFSGGLVPFYILIKGLGLRNTFGAVIIPYAITTYNLIIMRSAFDEIPESLIEAAEIEGANDLQVLWKIVIPVSKATMAVIALYYLVSAWNSWLPAALFFDKRQLFPLQLILREILISGSANDMATASGVDTGSANMYQAVKYSTIIIATVPILCVYPFLQKYFTKGVMIGAVKG